jgi:hypothetical protein
MHLCVLSERVRHARLIYVKFMCFSHTMFIFSIINERAHKRGDKRDIVKIVKSLTK